MSTTVSTRGSEISTATLQAPRLVPAVLSGARMHIDCPRWCVVDHAADPGALIEDLSHESDYVDLEASIVNKPDGLQLFARLGLDPLSADPWRQQPFLLIDGGSGPDDLTLDAADEFADSLVGFAAQIRELARAARDGGAQ
ncbi:hypothetical protein AB0C77_06715 [Streptomyces sp. NPDC048629]|uniref:DUF6907 domain-containing protein n=1 Tax=Streptomyces sp. NPDC048629 TaxID=3154824 RepID=UPI00341C8642